MNWFNKHLNWTYVIFFIISIIVSTVIVFKDQSIGYLALASVLSIIINLAAGGWVLYKKGQSLWFLVVAVIIPIVFIIIVLLANDKNEAAEQKDVINDDDYYKKRDKK